MKKVSIEERVMGSVAAIYAARLFTSATAIKVYALLLSVGGLTALVSLPNIVSNLVKVSESGVGSVAIFMLSAILGTTLVVQLALLAGAFAAISLVTPVLRGGRALA